MRMGTKSLLFGVHQFMLHPLFVALAWTKLYGFPVDPRLWVSFIIHDWGYYSKEKMDDKNGETHPYLGARIMRFFFGDEWGDFCLCHSRSAAANFGKPISQLCYADKFSIVLTPRWLYLLLSKATGELYEYMSSCDESVKSKYLYNESESVLLRSRDAKEWHKGLIIFVERWLREHKENDFGKYN